jgi:putative SOS response-associated peptidase YedK
MGELEGPQQREWVRTFTIITTDANELVAKIHPRLPVVIGPEDRERWLKGPNPKELLKPYAAERMTMWPVSPKLNSPKNDSPDLLEPIEEPASSATGDIERANEGAPDREPANSE